MSFIISLPLASPKQTSACHFTSAPPRPWKGCDRWPWVHRRLNRDDVSQSQSQLSRGLSAYSSLLPGETTMMMMGAAWTVSVCASYSRQGGSPRKRVNNSSCFSNYSAIPPYRCCFVFAIIIKGRTMSASSMDGAICHSKIIISSISFDSFKWINEHLKVIASSQLENK